VFQEVFEAWGMIQKGAMLPYLPTHRFAAEFGLETKHFGVHTSIQYVRKMCVTAGQGAYDEAFSTDAHVVADIGADVPVTLRVKLFASVRNVTNALYIVSRHPAGVRPGLSRLITLGLQTDS